MCITKAHYALIVGYKKEKIDNIFFNRDHFPDNSEIPRADSDSTD